VRERKEVRKGGKRMVDKVVLFRIYYRMKSKGETPRR